MTSHKNRYGVHCGCKGRAEHKQDLMISDIQYDDENRQLVTGCGSMPVPKIQGTRY